MNAKNFRLGNYYLENGVVKTITPNVIEQLFESEHRQWFEPIQISEEWFLKAGFIRKNGYGRIRSKLKGNIFISESGSHYVYQYYDIRIELKYVHELQNLYFILVGEELVFSSTEP